MDGDKHKILAVDDNPGDLEWLKRNLEPYGLEVDTTQYADSGREDGCVSKVKWDGTIEAVLLDYVLKNPDSRRGAHQRGSRGTLVGKLRQIRPGIPLFWITEWPDEVTDEHKKLTDDFFVKGDLRRSKSLFKRSARRTIEAIQKWEQNQFRAPFFEALLGYTRKGAYSWHTPGHSGGESLEKSYGLPGIREFAEFFGPGTFEADLSVSVEELDSLSEPTGVIDLAQKRAAEAFGAQQTFFVTNGTSAANKIVLQSLAGPGEKVLVDRNCHKSVHYAVIMSGVRPVYLMPSVNTKYGICGTVPMATIRKALETHRDAKVLVLTNCTYDGLIYDLPQITKLCHDSGVRLLVDEAWFGYAYFHPRLRHRSAMGAATDPGVEIYATQSTHKVLSAFSQASMIHVRGPQQDELGGVDAPRCHAGQTTRTIDRLIREHLMMHTSTSPQYAMIASLDIARKQMALEGKGLIDQTLTLACDLRQKIDGVGKGFRALELEEILADCAPAVPHDNIDLDPTKVTVSTAGFNRDEGVCARSVKQYLKSRGICVEKTTANTFTLLVTMAATKQKIEGLALALAQYSGGPPPAPVKPAVFAGSDICEPRMLPRDAYCAAWAIREDGAPAGWELLPVEHAVGRIAAVMVTPYPPGIPMLLPGDEITTDAAKRLRAVMQEHSEVHGLDGNQVWVVKQNSRTLGNRGA